MSEVFQLAYHSQGGFGHDEVYNMPVAKRRYYLNLLVEQKQKEEKQMEDAKKKKPHTPGALPKIKKPQ